MLLGSRRYRLHLEFPYEYLIKARSLLTAGGREFMTTGDLGSWNARLRGARWRQIHPPTHLRKLLTGDKVKER
jgi:hypothetical protein